MKSVIFGILIAGVVSVAASAAEIIPNAQVENVGADGANGSFFKLKSGMPPCAYNLFYFTNSTSTGKAILAMLLQSQATGIPVSRVVYEVSGGVCSVSLIGIGSSAPGY